MENRYTAPCSNLILQKCLQTIQLANLEATHCQQAIVLHSDIDLGLTVALEMPSNFRTMLCIFMEGM